MLIKAKCTKFYQDKQGNDCVQFVTEYGDSFSIKVTYCTNVPKIGDICMCRVKAAYYEGRSFLAFDVATVIN